MVLVFICSVLVFVSPAFASEVEVFHGKKIIFRTDLGETGGSWDLTQSAAVGQFPVQLGPRVQVLKLPTGYMICVYDTYLEKIAQIKGVKGVDGFSFPVISSRGGCNTSDSHPGNTYNLSGYTVVVKGK